MRCRITLYFCLNLFFLNRGKALILEEVASSVKAQLAEQAQFGVQVENKLQVPESGPVHSGLWWRIPGVTAVFVDLKRSTQLSASGGRKEAAYAYTYFIRAMAVILERFSAGYMDIQGDGIFGLFAGKGSAFAAAACAITMRTQMEQTVAAQFKKDSSSDWNLTAGIGVDVGTLLVRRLGLRGTKQNEVWAGKPVNVAAKLSSVAGDNQIVVSERVFTNYEKSSGIRRRALFRSCGCKGSSQGTGLSNGDSNHSVLWKQQASPKNLGLDFAAVYKRRAGWCRKHGAEYCEAIVTGKLPAG